MKLNNTQVCLDCEELYVGDQCPKCCSLNYFYLRKYFEPLQRFGGHYEPVTVRVFNPLPENLQGIQGNITVNPDSFTADPACGEFVDDGPQATHAPTTGDCGRNPAGSVSQVGGLDRASRVLGQAISRLLESCRRLDASPSADMESQVEQEGSHGSGA
jgi:hypothetical protein